MTIENVCFVCGRLGPNINGLCGQCTTVEALQPGKAYQAMFGWLGYRAPPASTPPAPPQLSEQQADRVDHGIEQSDGVGFDLADDDYFDEIDDDDDDESDYENASDQDYNDYEAETEEERLRQAAESESMDDANAEDQRKP